jgi:hypothetical protein
MIETPGVAPHNETGPLPRLFFASCSGRHGRRFRIQKEETESYATGFTVRLLPGLFFPLESGEGLE